MCNCNSSFCAVCCRRVKAYRFDNVPEITGDLQLYTEFYKVGEAYGHWKFTIDDLEAYLDIPTVLWQDKLVAFGHTATGGLFYDSAFIWNYTDSALTIGTRDIGAEGLYSFTIGNTNTAEGLYSLIVGASNVTNTTHSAVFGKANSILGSYNSIFGQANNINGNGNNVFGAGNIVGDNSNIFGASLDTNGFYGNAMFSDQTGGSLAIANDAFTAQFAGGYRFRLDASSTAVNISSTGIVTIDNVVNNNAEDQLLVWNSTTKEVEYRDVSSLPGGGGGSGTVTSVDAAFLNGTALTVVGGAITTAGTFDFEWQGLNTDYVAGDGSIIAFPTLTSGTVTSVSAGNGMTFTTITTSGAVTLGTPSSITLASTNSVGVGTHSHSFVPGGTTAQYIRGDGTLATTPLGSVTSVGMTITVSTALQVTGSPITTSGTFAVTWTGNNTQYVAGDGSLITFPTLTSGTVTAVNSGAGMDFTNFTTSGTIILGTPSTITLASVNAATGTTHSHEFDLGGSAGQYLAGDNTLQTFPTIPTVTPAALTKTDDTNILLNLTGTPSTSLLQAVDIAVVWSGTLAVSRGGSGAGTFTAGYLKANGTSAFTTVGAIPYSDISGTPTIPTQYWQRSAAVLSPLNLYDSLYLSGATGSVNTLLQLDYLSSSASNGARIDFTLSGSTVNGYVSNEVNGTLFFTNVYGIDGVSLQTKTGGVTSDVLIARANKTVYINTIPNFAGGTDFLVNNSGTISYRTISSFGTVTSIASGNGMNFSTITSTGTITMGMPSSISLVSTNSTSTTSHTHAFVPGGTSSQVILGNGGFGSYIPGLWQRSGSEIRPLNANDTVRITTTSTGVQTLLTLANTSADVNRAVRIDLGAGGIIQSYPDAANSFIQFLGGTNGVRFGTIAGGTFMSLTDNGSYVLLNTSQFVDTRLAVHRGTADEALHVGGKVKIDTISTVSSSTNLLTTNGGVVETRTIASLTGLPSSVWYLQGGTTASTNTSQNIYRTGDVWLNTGSTGAGGYKFRVTGDSYFEAQQYFAYATYQVWRNSANNAWLNGIRYNTSNQLELGQSSFDIYLPGYTSSRSVDTKTLLDKTLFVNSSGVVKSESSEWVRNDGASCWITSTESHLADNTNRRVTFDVSASTSNTYYTFSYSSGDYKMFFPGSYSQHLVICTLEYTTSGTPTVTATLRKTSTVIETNISTSADGRKVMTIHAIMSGTSSDYPTLYIYNATGGASITLQKCKITMIPLGETPP